MLKFVFNIFIIKLGQDWELFEEGFVGRPQLLIIFRSQKLWQHCIYDSGDPHNINTVQSP